MAVHYEWIVEQIDEHSGDIEDVESFECYSDAVETAAHWAVAGDIPRLIDIGLVRTSEEERTWAYVSCGMLPEHLETSNGTPAGKVPKRFNKEVTTYHSRVGNGKSVPL